MDHEKEHPKDVQSDQINRIIHAPARLVIMKILFVLEGGDMVFLKNQTNLTWGNLSVQVKKLEDAGYVTIKKEFVENKPHTIVSMADKGRIAFEDYSSKMVKMLK